MWQKSFLLYINTIEKILCIYNGSFFYITMQKKDTFLPLLTLLDMHATRPAILDDCQRQSRTSSPLTISCGMCL